VSAGILGGFIGAAIAILLHKRLRQKIEGGEARKIYILRKIFFNKFIEKDFYRAKIGGS
jgi:hypothetical protein